MATSLNLEERTVEAVKQFFSPFGKVTLVRFLNEGKSLPDDISALGLAMWRGPPGKAGQDQSWLVDLWLNKF